MIVQSAEEQITGRAQLYSNAAWFTDVERKQYAAVNS